MVENKDKALIDLYKGKKQLKKMLEDIVKLANERDIKDIKQLKNIIINWSYTLLLLVGNLFLIASPMRVTKPSPNINKDIETVPWYFL